MRALSLSESRNCFAYVAARAKRDSVENKGAERGRNRRSVKPPTFFSFGFLDFLFFAVAAPSKNVSSGKKKPEVRQRKEKMA